MKTPAALPPGPDDKGSQSEAIRVRSHDDMQKADKPHGLRDRARAQLIKLGILKPKEPPPDFSQGKVHVPPPEFTGVKAAKIKGKREMRRWGAILTGSLAAAGITGELAHKGFEDWVDKGITTAQVAGHCSTYENSSLLDKAKHIDKLPEYIEYCMISKNFYESLKSFDKVFGQEDHESISFAISALASFSVMLWLLSKLSKIKNGSQLAEPEVEDHAKLVTGGLNELGEREQRHEARIRELEARGKVLESVLERFLKGEGTQEQLLAALEEARSLAEGPMRVEALEIGVPEPAEAAKESVAALPSEISTGGSSA